MTVGEIREVSPPSTRALIEKDGNVLFADWFYKVPEDLLKAKVKEFAFSQEIRHKDWEKLGLKRKFFGRCKERQTDADL